jgi:CBS domain-containing protein
MKESLKTPASRVMSTPVVTIPRGLPVKQAARMLLEKRLSGAPVVDGEGRGVGVLTLRDIVRYAEWHLECEEAAEDQRDLEIARELDRRVRLEPGQARGRGMRVDRMDRASVDQIMTPRLAFVRGDAPLRDVIRTFGELGVHRVFVCGKTESIVGVISTIDVVRALAGAKRRARGTRRA